MSPALSASPARAAAAVKDDARDSLPGGQTPAQRAARAEELEARAEARKERARAAAQEKRERRKARAEAAAAKRKQKNALKKTERRETVARPERQRADVRVREQESESFDRADPPVRRARASQNRTMIGVMVAIAVVSAGVVFWLKR